MGNPFSAIFHFFSNSPLDHAKFIVVELHNLLSLKAKVQELIDSSSDKNASKTSFDISLLLLWERQYLYQALTGIKSFSFKQWKSDEKKDLAVRKKLVVVKANVQGTILILETVARKFKSGKVPFRGIQTYLQKEVYSHIRRTIKSAEHFQAFLEGEFPDEISVTEIPEDYSEVA